MYISDMELEIYSYDDFRVYLRDLFEVRKKIDPQFSHRRFAELAGVRNPGTLVDIIQGRRALSRKVCEACVRIFDLKPQQAEFFRLLVEYGQERNPDLRAKIWREIQNRRARSNFVRLNAAQVRYYEDHTYALVLAAVECLGFQGDYESLAATLRPPLAPARARRCVEDLCTWGMLRRDQSGTYHVVSRFIEPPPRLREPVRRMNRAWIVQAADALTLFPPEERHISTAILAVSEEARRKIEERIVQCRHEIFAIANADTRPEVVMQFSVQYFPRTQKREKK